MKDTHLREQHADLLHLFDGEQRVARSMFEQHVEEHLQRTRMYTYIQTSTRYGRTKLQPPRGNSKKKRKKTLNAVVNTCNKPPIPFDFSEIRAQFSAVCVWPCSTDPRVALGLCYGVSVQKLPRSYNITTRLV